MSTNPRSSEEGPQRATGRPFVLSGGRTEPRHLLDLRTFVSVTRTAAELEDLTPQHRRVLDACRAESVTVADVVVGVPYPLLVARILISDLIDKGALTHRLTVLLDEAPEPEFLRRLSRALHKMDVPDSPAADGRSGHAC
ncbi:DUF742 domain-containing protein [Streptomyces bobili]|uniref:DUF742 domain-containing protein n=1 Tax=Streptomyces bobili TaxID=67280 RepID=UPI0033AFA284